MRVFYLDHSLAKARFSSSSRQEEALLFARGALPHLLELQNIPLDLQEAIKKVLKTFKIGFYQKPVGDPGSTLLISATDSQLKDLGEALATKEESLATLSQLIAKAYTAATTSKTPPLMIGGKSYPLNKKTYVMGILNVTPDSFSDGGSFANFDKALAQIYQMAEEGADIIDIGGESTRPGYEKAHRVTAEEEMKRVLPLIETIKKDSSFKLPLSIDTYKAATAKQALSSGADLLNDVWGFKEDPDIAAVAASYDVPVCLMHNRRSTDYDDLIPDILEELKESVALAEQAGVKKENIIIDPGFGFGKNYEQNLEVMYHLPAFKALGFPLLLGTSRKSMIGKTLDLPPGDRVEGTAATVAYGISLGADIIRVHDVKQMKRVAKMTDAMARR